MVLSLPLVVLGSNSIELFRIRCITTTFTVFNGLSSSININHAQKSRLSLRETKIHSESS